MPGINRHHLYRSAFGFVRQESSQLGKAPTVQPSSTFPTPLFGGASNLAQILNHNRSARGTRLDYAFRQNVVTVPSKPLHFLTEVLQMGFSALGSFGLQSAVNSKVF